MKYSKGFTKAQAIKLAKAIGRIGADYDESVRAIVKFHAEGVAKWTGTERAELVTLLREQANMSKANANNAANAVKAYKAVNTELWHNLDGWAPTTVGTIGTAITGKRADSAAKAIGDGASVREVRQRFGNKAKVRHATAEDQVQAAMVHALKLAADAKLTDQQVANLWRKAKAKAKATTAAAA